MEGNKHESSRSCRASLNKVTLQPPFGAKLQHKLPIFCSLLPKHASISSPICCSLLPKHISISSPICCSLLPKHISISSPICCSLLPKHCNQSQDSIFCVDQSQGSELSRVTDKPQTDKPQTDQRHFDSLT